MGSSLLPLQQRMGEVQVGELSIESSRKLFFCKWGEKRNKKPKKSVESREWSSSEEKTDDLRTS